MAEIDEKEVQQEANITQIVDLYGADYITRNILPRIEDPKIMRSVISAILCIDRELWVRSLPHGPGSKKEPVGHITYYVDDEVQVTFQRCTMGPGGVIGPMRVPRRVRIGDPSIERFKKTWGGEAQEGLIVKLYKILANKLRGRK